MIDFADNEGVIGSVVSEKLYKDFANNYEAAKVLPTGLDREYWFNRYENWMKAFEMARHNGAVDFH